MNVSSLTSIQEISRWLENICMEYQQLGFVVDTWFDDPLIISGACIKFDDILISINRHWGIYGVICWNDRDLNDISYINSDVGMRRPDGRDHEYISSFIYNKFNMVKKKL